MTNEQKQQLFSECFALAEQLRDAQPNTAQYSEAKGAYWAMRKSFKVLGVYDAYMAYEEAGIKAYIASNK